MPEEREIELVAGTIGGITQKKADTWTVAVTPEGSQYAKNLWTKDADLVEALAAKIGQHGGFACVASYWERDGKQIRSLWIEETGSDVVDVSRSVATPGPSVQVGTNATGALPNPQPSRNAATEGMTPEKWDAKERRDYRSRAWAQTLGAFTHTIKVDEDPQAVFTRLQPFQRKVYEDVCGMFAYDPSLDDVPFG